MAAGFFVFWRLGLNGQEKAFDSEKQQTQAADNSDQSMPAGEAEGQVQGLLEENLNNCQRVFDREKLQTGQIDIKNKTVEFLVRDFGKISLELYEKDAPLAVENFLRLVNAGYYDCLTFHRVAKGFVIQSGDPTGTGSGGESAFGGEFVDELDPQKESYKQGYKKGVLAMANRGSNTNTSQFFIMLEDASLPNDYTIFGRVVSGQAAVDKIGQVDITPGLGPTDGKPVFPVVIEKAIIVNSN